MALFQRKIHDSSVQPLYSTGANKSALLVGLGNPGAEYEKTRHNLGFEALSYFASSNNFPNWINKKDLKSEISINNIGDTRVILCKPATFMNASGEAVGAVQRFYRIYNQSTLVVHDELSIGFGQIRTRVGGSDAGHNGIKSLTQYIGEDFNRVRIGIGNNLTETTAPEDFVLGKFTKSERDKLELINREFNSIALGFLLDGKLEQKTIAVI